MLAHLVQLIFWGLTKLALCSLLIYSLLIYFPAAPLIPGRHNPCANSPDPTLCRARITRFAEQIAHSWGYDRPWPLSYFAWLFDPEKKFIFDLQGNPIPYPNSVNISIGELQLIGSGVLTGDFGESSSIDLGTPVVDMFGHGIDKMFAFLIVLIALLMVLIAAQRCRRPQPYRVSTTPTASALVDWWHLHANSPLDIAVVRRQVG